MEGFSSANYPALIQYSAWEFIDRLMERIIELLECKLNSVNLKNESSIKVFNECGFNVLFFKQKSNEIEETKCDHSSNHTSVKE